MNKYPDKIANILRKQNSTIKGENQDFDQYINYLSRALRKMSKSIFFDYKQSDCPNGNIDMSSKTR